MSLRGFNLLQDVTRPQDVWDKIYDWVVNVGRIIVIAVEGIVILSFVIRIGIDVQAKDLMKAEKLDSQQLVALKPNEIRFIDMQSRFTDFKNIWNVASSYSNIFSEIIALLPERLHEPNLILKGNLITISGESSVSDIENFENALKNSEKYDDVQVSEIETISSNSSSGSPKANFSMRILIKNNFIQNREQIGSTEPTEQSNT